MSDSTGASITKIIALLMSLFTTLSSVITILKTADKYTDWPAQPVGIEEKQEGVQLRVMTFNIRCTNVGKEQWYDRVDIVSQKIIDARPD